jgi:hypothetical protein
MKKDINDKKFEFEEKASLPILSFLLQIFKLEKDDENSSSWERGFIILKETALIILNNLLLNNNNNDRDELKIKSYQKKFLFSIINSKEFSNLEIFRKMIEELFSNISSANHCLSLKILTCVCNILEYLIPVIFNECSSFFSQITSNNNIHQICDIFIKFLKLEFSPSTEDAQRSSWKNSLFVFWFVIDMCFSFTSKGKLLAGLGTMMRVA